MISPRWKSRWIWRRPSAYGLKPGDVRRAAAYLMAGEEVGDIHAANRTYDVNVWSTPETRNSLTRYSRICRSTHPPVARCVWRKWPTSSIVPVPNAINRENLARRIDVEAEVEGRDLGSVVADVEQRSRRDRVPTWVPPGADR